MTVKELREMLEGRPENETVKIAGWDITSVDTVPAEGGEPGYLDLVGI